MILAIACAKDLEVHQADVITAYLRAELHAEVYVCKIDGITLPANKVLQVRKVFYKLKQAGCEWYIEACNTLAKFGLQPTFNNPSVFVNTDKSLVVGLFVDDMIIVVKTLDAVEEFKKGFRSIHKIKDLGEIYKYLGLTITRDRAKRTLCISQESFTRKLVDEYLSPRDYTCPTLVSNSENLTKAKLNEPRADIT